MKKIDINYQYYDKSNIKNERHVMRIKPISIKSEFESGSNIPNDCACNSCGGKNFSPPISWERIDNAITYALICEDPDAPHGTYTHWIVFNIPNNITQLTAGENIKSIGGTQGTNSSGNTDYVGMCPPGQEKHRYIFTIYALDNKLNLPESVNAEQFKKSIENHIIAKGSLMGHYACKLRE